MSPLLLKPRLAAAISISPKQASAITTAAINAVLKQAPAITSAAVSAAPLQAAIITQAALKAAGSTEIRRLIAVAASNAGVSEQVINKVLQDVTNKNGSYEIFKKDADDAVSSTITKGSSSESNNSPLGVAVPIGSTGATGSTGGGGVIACVKNGVTASCS